MSRKYIQVSPDRIGWKRINPWRWIANDGREVELSPNNPVVEVPVDYPDLQT